MSLHHIIKAYENQLTTAQHDTYQEWVSGQLEHVKAANKATSLPLDVQHQIRLETLAHLLHGVPKEQAFTDPEARQQAIHAADVNHKYREHKTREEAKERYRAEQAAAQAAALTLPQPVELDRFIRAALDHDETWRIDNLWPEAGRILLTAPYKAGKTTLIANLVRALTDGGLFLGQHKTTPANGVLLIDTEMTPAQLGRWYHQQNITNQDRVEVLSLRGQCSTFDILTPEGRARWAQQIEGAEVVILDNLRPILDGLGLDENHEAGRFLTAWDELIAEMIGAKESLIVTHTGHDGDRARGDSALLASNDGLWNVARLDSEDPASPRFFRAYGRGFDQPEHALTLDPDTGHLTLTEGTRKQAIAAAKAGDAQDPEGARLQAVLRFLVHSPGTNMRGLRVAIPGKQQVTSDAVQLGIDQGFIERRPSGRSYAHYLTPAGRQQAEGVEGAEGAEQTPGLDSARLESGSGVEPSGGKESARAVGTSGDLEPNQQVTQGPGTYISNAVQPGPTSVSGKGGKDPAKTPKNPPKEPSRDTTQHP